MGQKKGLALIMVMVMVLIFLSIIMAVVLSATMAIRRASYASDKLIALEIAESGIQDCLYWMNYKGYWNHRYPSAYVAPVAYFRGSDWAGDDTWVFQEVSFHPGGNSQGRCVLFFEDNDGFDQDRIVATGWYRGRQASVEVRLKGNNGTGNSNHIASGRWLCDWNGTDSGVATWGIPEVFNKHAIYAYEVGSPASTVNGNLTYKTTTETTLLWNLPGKKTITRDEKITTSPPWNYFPITSSFPPFPVFPSEPLIFDQSFDKRTDQYGNRWDTYYRYGTVNTGTKIWYFDNTQSPPPGQVISASIRLVWGGNPPGDLHITDENNGRTFTNYLYASDGAIYFETSLTVSGTGPVFKAQNGLNFSSGITVYCTNGGWLALDRASAGSVSMNNVTIKDGPLFTGSGITSLTLTNCNLDASGSAGKQALLLSAGTASLTGCQVKGLVYAGSSVSSLTLSSCTLDASSSVETGALLVKGGSVTLSNCTVYGGIKVEGSGTVTLNNTKVYSNPWGGNIAGAVVTRGKLVIGSGSEVRGLVLVLSETGSDDCLFSSGKVEGSLVVKGRLSLSGGSVSYLSSLAWKGSEIFQAFVGGRRIYLPVPGSWRVY